MAEPWFDPNSFGAWFGGIGGSVAGILGGVIGTLCGTLLPRGKGRGPVVGSFGAMAVLGLLSLAFGLYALGVGQPYGIWYGPVLLGAILTFLGGLWFFLARRMYAEVEQRRLEAEAIRAGGAQEPVPPA